MNDYFLFHGMLVQLTRSILELYLCPLSWRGKVFRVQWKVRMMSSGVVGSEIVFVITLTLKNKALKRQWVGISVIARFSAHYSWISCFEFVIPCDASDLLAFLEMILIMRQTFTHCPGQYDDSTKTFGKMRIASVFHSLLQSQSRFMRWCVQTHECHSRGCLFIPVAQCILFSNKVIAFQAAKDYAEVQLFSCRAGRGPGPPSWHMALVHYQLGSPLPARFPGSGWTELL